jgi:hypothetical protein
MASLFEGSAGGEGLVSVAPSLTCRVKKTHPEPSSTARPIATFPSGVLELPFTPWLKIPTEASPLHLRVSSGHPRHAQLSAEDETQTDHFSLGADGVGTWSKLSFCCSCSLSFEPLCSFECSSPRRSGLSPKMRAACQQDELAQSGAFNHRARVCTISSPYCWRISSSAAKG